MKASVRKLSLTAHVSSSVGWLGAVLAFLALAITGVTSRDADLVRGVYLAMNLVGLFVIIPLGLAALVTGLVQAFGTHWGLFRYYWVVVKFTLTVGAIVLLLLHQFTAVSRAASRAAGTLPGVLPEIGRLGNQLVVDAVLALLVLLVTTVLSIYKPWGKTQYGRRQRDELTRGGATELPLVVKILLAVLGLLVVGFIVLHLAGGGLTHGQL
jgi:hypothetical protein